MRAVENLVSKLSCPARVTIAGPSSKEAMATMAKRIDVVDGLDMLLGIIITSPRDDRTFVPWERIVTIECIKEEPA